MDKITLISWYYRIGNLIVINYYLVYSRSWNKFSHFLKPVTEHTRIVLVRRFWTSAQTYSLECVLSVQIEINLAAFHSVYSYLQPIFRPISFPLKYLKKSN